MVCSTDSLKVCLSDKPKTLRRRRKCEPCHDHLRLQDTRSFAKIDINLIVLQDSQLINNPVHVARFLEAKEKGK